MKPTGMAAIAVAGWLAGNLAINVPEAVASTTHPRNVVAFYTDTYGELLPADDPQVAGAVRVFERVRAVADRSSKRLPRLVVVDSDGKPWAIALPDGHIVLSRQAVRTCFNLGGQAEPCLAFVLGHELAHLANDDFWHQEVHGFLADNPLAKRFAGIAQGQWQVEERELAADDKGYVYAAMAGYAVGALLEPQADGKGFFGYWLQQTNARASTAASKAEVRTAVLRQRLTAIQDKLVFFEFGVRLSHFDYCDDAVYFLQEFQQVFPGREVLNNLGYCYLQMARQAMASARAFFYWMPLQLDGETRATALVARGGARLTSLKQAVNGGEAEGELRQAVDYLEQASKADPSYVPARVNLAVAYLYLGQAHRARATLAEARELAPDRLDIQGLDALALYEQSDPETDLWSSAVQRLQALAGQRGASQAVLFNLARLHEVRAHHAKARRYWEQLANAVDRLPDPISGIVCRALGAAPTKGCARDETVAGTRSSWPWPLQLGGLEPVSAKTIRHALVGWARQDFDWIKDHLHGHIYFRPDGGAVVLELDGFVQMQVLKVQDPAPISELQRYCGRSLRQRSMPQGVVSSCGDWAALAAGDRVREIWWIAR